PQKRRPGRRFSAVMGGTLGLISLLVFLIITLKPILFVPREPSSASTHPSKIVQKWAFPTGGSVVSSPRIVNGVLYVGSHDHKVRAIDASNGQEKWAFTTGDVVWSSPIIANGVLYVGSWDHNVYAIDANTGQEKWVFPTGGLVSTSPTVIDNVLYVGSDDKSVYAIDTDTGQQKWVFTTTGYSGFSS